MAKMMYGLNKAMYKLNIKDVEYFDIDEVCSDIQREKSYNNKEMHDELNVSLQHKLQSVKDDIIKDDLSFHQINPRVPYPKNFSTGPVLRDSQKRSEIAKFLPNGRNKFTGTDSGPSVIEFLSNMNEISETFKLSEPEFQKYLRMSCTKEPFMVVSNDMEAGCDTSIIYNRLLMLYNKEQTPESAKKELLNYKAKKIHDFSKVSGDILRLATRASSIIPISHSREHLKNTEANHILINCMPPHSKNLLDQLYHNLMSRKKSPPTFHDFVQVILPNRSVIDDDIRRFGAHGNENVKYDNKFDRPNRPYKVYNIDNFTPYAPRRQNFNQNRNNRSSYRRQDSKIFEQGSNFQPNKQPFFPRNRFMNDKKCLLCGKTNHKASDGCYAMRNNQNRVINVVPVQAPCPSCLSKNNKLFHELKYCPFRKELQKFRNSAGNRTQ
jgi:hypothetical protein